MSAYANGIACRCCGRIFPHVVALLNHFEQVHCRDVYTPKIQRNGLSVSRTTHFKLYSKHGNSQIPLRRNDHAIFGSMFKDTRGQVNKDMERDPIDFTLPLIKKLDKPITVDNVEEVEDQNLDLNLKL